jgi:hypothetical protein
VFNVQKYALNFIERNPVIHSNLLKAYVKTIYVITEVHCLVCRVPVATVHQTEFSLGFLPMICLLIQEEQIAVAHKRIYSTYGVCTHTRRKIVPTPRVRCSRIIIASCDPGIMYSGLYINRNLQVE